MRIRLLPEAEQDLADAADFYESQRAGLGRYLSKRFPFAIFYDVSGDMVDVYAILDCRRDPAAIRMRTGR